MQEWFEMVSCHISSESTYSRLEREKWHDSRSQSLSIIEAKSGEYSEKSRVSSQSILYASTPKPTSREKTTRVENPNTLHHDASLSPLSGDSISYSRDLVKCAKSFAVP